MGGLPVEVAPDPTLLVVGSGDAWIEGIAEATARHGVAVEHSSLELCAQAAVAVAPDALLLVGDAAANGGTEALELLSASPLAAVVPVLLFGDHDEDLSERLAAFARGATAYVTRSASVDATARRLAELVRDIPEGGGAQVGRLGETSLDALAQTVARELRQGILSVRGIDSARGDEEIRLVVGEGAGVHAAVRQLVTRLEELIDRAEVVRYEWEDEANGGLSLLSALAGDTTEVTPTIEGARVLLADDDVARADVVAQELRDAGAVVAVVDPRGRGLTRARALDPQALVVGDSIVHGPGFELVRRLRADARMRWAHMIVVPWDEAWTEVADPPRLDSLVRRIARATAVERAIHQRVVAKRSFDLCLETLGAARLLRQLGHEDERLRLTVWNLRGTVRVDVGDGLVIGAGATLPGKAGGEREGIAALAALLPLASGRVRVERVASPLSTNVMSPVDEALGQAEEETPAAAPEAPPRSLRERSRGSVIPVAIAQTEPPPGPTESSPDAAGSVPPPPRVARRVHRDREDPTTPSHVTQELALASIRHRTAGGPGDPAQTVSDRETTPVRISPRTRARAGRRGGGLLTGIGALLVIAAAVGVAWWTGWPPEAWAAVSLEPRVDDRPAQRASRPPQPDRWEPPAISVAGAPVDSSGDRAAGAAPTETRTPLHAHPEGADPSFEVPEWIGDLGPRRRASKARSARVLGYRNLRNGRADRALTWYRRAWWFQESALTARGISQTYLALDDPARAMPWARRAVELHGDDPYAFLALGDVYRARDELDAARAAYDQALQVAPQNRTARLRLDQLDSAAPE